MTRYPPEHKERTRSRILLACRQHVHRSGLGAGLEGVMAEIGLTKGGFYTHFPSKNHLLQETLANAFEQQRAEVRRRFDEAETDRAALESIFDCYLSSSHLDDADRGCPVPHCLSDLARADDELRKPFNDYREWLVDQVADRLTGDYASCRQLAVAIVSLAIGAASIARVETDPDQRERILESARNVGRDLISSSEAVFASSCGEPPFN